MKEKPVKKSEKVNKDNVKVKEKRCHHISFMLNDTEYKAIQRHLKKYKITNKANFYRRTILAHILQKIGEDLPMLFDEKDMRLEQPSLFSVAQNNLFDF